MEQLELLESMGGVMDRSHIKYRTYQLNKLALGFQSGKYAQGEYVTQIFYLILYIVNNDYHLLYALKVCVGPQT